MVKNTVRFYSCLALYILKDLQFLIKNKQTLQKMSLRKAIYSTALLLSAQTAYAAIAEDGLWTGNDWYDADNKIGV